MILSFFFLLYCYALPTSFSEFYTGYCETGIKYMRGEPLLQLKSTGYSNLYREDVDPAVSNSFASAAMRSIGSMIEDQIRSEIEGILVLLMN